MLAAGMDQVAGKLTDPQYAVVKQLRTPVVVVITFQKEGSSSGAPIEYEVV